MTFSLYVVLPDKFYADALAHILVTANEHAFRGLVPDQCLEFTEAESSANWQKFFAEEFIPDGNVMLAAKISDDKVIGYFWSSLKPDDNNFDAEIRQIYVLPEYQRQGLGQHMVRSIARSCLVHGKSSLKVDVLKANPNRLFYERLGAEIVSEQTYNWNGVDLPEYTYAWRDKKSLAAIATLESK